MSQSAGAVVPEHVCHQQPFELSKTCHISTTNCCILWEGNRVPQACSSCYETPITEQARCQQNSFGGALDGGRGAHGIEALSRDAEGVELRGAIGAENWDAEGVEGLGNGEGVSPSPANWGSVVSSPSGVRGRAPAENDLVFFKCVKTPLVATFGGHR